MRSRQSSSAPAACRPDLLGTPKPNDDYFDAGNGPYDVDLAKVATVWNNGSVIRSWLNELAVEAFARDADLSAIAGVVGGGETGGWTLNTAIELASRCRPSPWRFSCATARARRKASRARS